MEEAFLFKWVFLVLVGMVAVLAPLAQTAQAADPVTLQVYDPTGAFEVTQPCAPRLDDLNGKTICEIGDNLWETQRTFPLIRSLLQKQFPTAKIIPHDGLPAATTDAAMLGETVKQAGCQGVIVGNAG